MSTNIFQCEIPFYIWCWNKNSYTKSQNISWPQDTIIVNMDIIDYCRKQKKDDLIPTIFLEILISNYFLFQQEEFENFTNEEQNAIKKLVKYCFNKYKDLWNKIPLVQWRSLYKFKNNEEWHNFILWINTL